eukprot:TRINITY_DN9354_c0_g1_i4.p1 TRINITY_DN9354_c0_g1~~TRINITY_DN9354_c0_g1_i4.p1  ORF type:complete len:316 (+),score=3.37 TRINITY_DN9354_c0_g1_i4:446-1393(+)
MNYRVKYKDWVIFHEALQDSPHDTYEADILLFRGRGKRKECQSKITGTGRLQSECQDNKGDLQRGKTKNIRLLRCYVGSVKAWGVNTLLNWMRASSLANIRNPSLRKPLLKAPNPNRSNWKECKQRGKKRTKGRKASQAVKESKQSKAEMRKKKKIIWGIGMYERGTGNVMVFADIKRDFEVIKQMCKDHIEPGATLYTDGWGAYKRLGDLMYKHIDIKKQEGFKKEPLSTSKIEGTWAELKQFARTYSKAVPPKHCDEYLREFILRRECRRNSQRMVLKLVEIFLNHQLICDIECFQANSNKEILKRDSYQFGT